MIKNLPWGLLQRIPFLPLGEIGYRTLGRGGAVGAPAHPRVPALTKTAAFIGGNGLNVLPINADCRGGVFAVFAKISPPTRFTIREDFPAHLSTLRAYPIGFLPISHPLHGVWDYLKLGDAHAFGLAL